MFGFGNRKKNQSTDALIDVENERKKREKDSLDISVGFTATEAAFDATAEAARVYAKPDTYAGNRKLYDSGDAKLIAKKKLFEGGQTVIDPYTGNTLVLTKKEAKLMYGQDWQKHLAESDHIKPLKKIYEDTRNNVWNTTDDIKNAANSDDNMRVVSRKYNNAKRDRTNKELIENEKYLESKGLRVSKKGKERALKDGELAEQSINQQLKSARISNIVQTGHKAGKIGAQNAGITALTVSGIMNLVAVIKGEKDSDAAIADTVRDGGKAAVSGYLMGGGLTVISHSLSNSASQFIRGLAESNVPGKVITAVIVTGDTLKKWGNGEITTQQCLIELGDKGLNMATMGYSMAVGQALIPIPVVGGAIGALVGSMLTSEYYNSLINELQVREMEHQERLRIITECTLAAEQAKKFREELEVYLQNYLSDYRECFDGALSSMRFAYEMRDADGMIAS